MTEQREQEIALIVAGAESLRRQLEAVQAELAKYKALPRMEHPNDVYRTDTDVIVPGWVLAQLVESGK